MWQMAIQLFLHHIKWENKADMENTLPLKNIPRGPFKKGKEVKEW